jgi:uncharacterized protein (TIGR03067 family)
MPWSLLLGFMASCCLVGVDDKSDQDKLQGDWKLESGKQAGENTPEEFVKEFSLTIKGDKWSVKIPGGEDKGTIKIDSSKKPKEINFTSESGAERQSIYDLDGDTLKVCVSEPGGNRPTEFDSKAGSPTMYFVLKRKK